MNVPSQLSITPLFVTHAMPFTALPKMVLMLERTAPSGWLPLVAGRMSRMVTHGVMFARFAKVQIGLLPAPPSQCVHESLLSFVQPASAKHVGSVVEHLQKISQLPLKELGNEIENSRPALSSFAGQAMAPLDHGDPHRPSPAPVNVSRCSLHGDSAPPPSSSRVTGLCSSQRIPPGGREQEPIFASPWPTDGLFLFWPGFDTSRGSRTIQGPASRLPNHE
ncbi:hypothetical protein PAXRUDRAFT_11724 [Paxillus rubicundulus Ve08.2h10]|uniref:Uncharacterized protein n=1 Tax=Paxillus rubicundulus Ve08.2h10 TaxID=930991 RepID=A0A0D0DQT8_9AGAM|nr:hypothetical protein PAXRUDRAFT_11724 [Paxillus rubicundulus Ve08.2h10]